MMLLVYSDSRFHAKVSRVKRKDGMCFWVSRQAFHVLENFFLNAAMSSEEQCLLLRIAESSGSAGN